MDQEKVNSKIEVPTTEQVIKDVGVPPPTPDFANVKQEEIKTATPIPEQEG